MREWLVSTLGSGATALAIVVAIIGLTGTLGGAAATFLLGRKTVYLNAITAERMKWVSLLRTNIATLIGHLTIVQAAKINKDTVALNKLTETFFMMNQIAKMIELQLNPQGAVDKSIVCILKTLYKSTGADSTTDIDEITNSLIFHSQWLLKDEWERVKFEARGFSGKILSLIRMKIRSLRYRKFAIQ